MPFVGRQECQYNDFTGRRVAKAVADDQIADCADMAGKFSGLYFGGPRLNGNAQSGKSRRRNRVFASLATQGNAFGGIFGHGWSKGKR